MCLILFALDQHPDLSLVVAANRDEFFRRPTAAMKWWPDTRLLAGQDLEAGGTWLAVAPDGTITAVTNVREGAGETGRNSRGTLPLLAQSLPAEDLQQQLIDEAGRYSGFNLIRLTPGSGNSAPASGWYFSNRDAHPGRTLYRGSYGLSNELLQSPWPKLVRLREQLRSALNNPALDRDDDLHEHLLGLLQDSAQAPDHLLPDTGIDRNFERLLSSPFIVGEDYGTRASTLITVRRSGTVKVTEQTWGRGGRTGERLDFSWQIPGSVADTDNR